jgi:hypothetical protein
LNRCAHMSMAGATSVWKQKTAANIHVTVVDMLVDKYRDTKHIAAVNTPCTPRGVAFIANELCFR